MKQLTKFFKWLPLVALLVMAGASTSAYSHFYIYRTGFAGYYYPGFYGYYYPGFYGYGYCTFFVPGHWNRWGYWIPAHREFC